MNSISKANIPSFFFVLSLSSPFFSNNFVQDFNIIRITEPKLEKKIMKMAASSLLRNKSPKSHKLFYEKRERERRLSTLYSYPPQALPSQGHGQVLIIAKQSVHSL